MVRRNTFIWIAMVDGLMNMGIIIINREIERVRREKERKII